MVFKQTIGSKAKCPFKEIPLEISNKVNCPEQFKDCHWVGWLISNLSLLIFVKKPNKAVIMVFPDLNEVAVIITTQSVHVESCTK